jgi:hypothetical protein
MPDWDWRMQIYEPASFARKYLLPRLDVQPMEGPLALHVTCSSQRSGNAGDMEALARALAKKVRGRLGPGRESRQGLKLREYMLCGPLHHH